MNSFLLIEKDWLTSFMKRQHLAVRAPEATSLARQSSFNRPAVENFYNKLSDALERLVLHLLFKKCT